ncbi:MAG: hypothetical protein A3J06_00605 [Candidatus Moranbacteria bacterium RIFCSPLOWO2_02_FULL_48_19]|nr:MAG: hypothetical protein A3J06_00605 [Candidatus Moranbacteria bacterium RIFCSPLOWO2_02_FULL_48_19]OGI30574.1 MAG: hypothetical protein A3G09_00650 [Candidatus Moranbacteria bacterium RIFCSPLOWO2_12_FULL_48_12]
MVIKDGVKVFVKNRKLGKYLFCLRDNKPTILYPNMWGLLGGGIEHDETPLQALEREIGEETNIKLYDIKELGSRPITHTFMENGVERKKRCRFFVFLAQTDADLNEAELYEGQRFEYFTLKEVKKQDDLSPPTKVMIAMCEDHLV